MLILALALAGQAATLPAEGVEAARICSALEVRSMISGPTLEAFSRALHLNLLAARATRGRERMLDHLPVEQQIVMERVIAQTDDPALSTECKVRFPQVWGTDVTLPSDGFDRATICVAASVAIKNLAMALGDTAETKRWDALTERVSRLPILSNAEHRRHGINSGEAGKDNADRMMRESLDSSGFLAISRSCEIAYPA